MRELKIMITHNGDGKVITQLKADGRYFEEVHNFVDAAHGDGMMADLFHELTGNRYKTPTNDPFSHYENPFLG